MYDCEHQAALPLARATRWRGVSRVSVDTVRPFSTPARPVIRFLGRCRAMARVSSSSKLSPSPPERSAPGRCRPLRARRFTGKYLIFGPRHVAFRTDGVVSACYLDGRGSMRGDGGGGYGWTLTREEWSALGTVTRGQPAVSELGDGFRRGHFAARQRTRVRRC